jgi:hypothetical protein
MRTRILKTITLLAAIASVGAQAAVVTIDFNSGLPANSALYNGSNPVLPGPSVSPAGGVGDSGVLKLTEAVGGQQGSWVLEDINSGIPITNMVVRYKARVGGGSNPPADGYSFCFGADLPNASWGEEGAGTGLTVAFDTYVNAETGETNRHVDVKYGGVVVAHTGFDVSSGTNFIDMTITVCGNGRVSVLYGTQTVIDRAPTGYVPVAGRFGFGARTGGAYDNHWIDDLVIDTSDPLAVAITNQPASRVVNEGQAATFTVGVNGLCYNSIQWFSNGVVIPGAESLSYSTPPATLAMNGAVYRAEITDSTGTVVSDNATLTVVPAPVVVGASTRLNPNGVFVFFNKNVSGTTALNTGNYQILSGGITVTGAVFNSFVATNGERSVVLLQTTPAFVHGQTYTLRVTAVQDDDSNVILPNPTDINFTHAAGTYCYDFNSGLPAGNTVYGNARVDSSGGIYNSGALKVTDAALSQSGAFRTSELIPGHSVARIRASYMMRADTPQTGNPADGHSLNIANDLPAGTYAVAEEGQGTGLSVSFDNWDSGAPDNAPAIEIKWNGQIVPGGHRSIPKHNYPAYIPVVLNVDPDGTVDLEMHGTNVFSNLPTPFQPIMGARLGLGGRTGGAFQSHWFDDLCVSIFNGGPVNFPQPLTNRTVLEARPYQFRLNVDGTPPYYIQWFSNSVPVPGANSEVLSGIATLDVSGAQFYAVVSNEFSSATSATATLTVTEDTQAPVLLSARANRNLNMITLVFDEELDFNTATDPVNVTIDGLTILDRYLTNNGTTLVLITSAQNPESSYDVTLAFVYDKPFKNQISAVVPVRTWVISRGFVQTEIYKEIYGTVVANLTGAGKFPNQPDLSLYSHMTEWRQPQTGNPSRPLDEPWNNYGVRMSGYFIPRLDGIHRFYFTHDDEAQMKLSPDANPAGAVVIVTATGVRNIPYADFAPQFIDSPALVAGQSYYFEVLMKEGGGGDYLSVGVREPGNTLGTNSITAIQNFSLAALADPLAAPALSITQQPTNVIAEAGQQVEFSVGTSYTGNNLPFHVWKVDGVAVAGAHGPTFVHTAAASASVTVEVHLPGTNVTSAAASLTVIPDTTGPIITGSVVLNSTNVSIGFSEPIAIDAPASLTDPANYLVNDTPGLVESVTVMTPSSVRLTVSGALAGTTTVRASIAIEDAAGNPVVTSVGQPGYSVAFTSIPVKSWTDIGSTAAPQPPGTVFTVNNRDFVVSAGGQDVWSGGDQFTYIYEQRTGDFDVKVRVDRIDRVGDDNAKAGINVRDSLNGTPGFAGRMAWIYPVPTNGNGQFQAAIRPEPGRDVIDVNFGGYGRRGRGNSSAWVRIKRVGKSFTYYNSYDGRNWNPVGVPRVANANPENGTGGIGQGIADAINFPETLYVGLGTVSHVQSNATTAIFADYGEWSYPGASATVLHDPEDTTGYVGGTARFVVSGAVSGAPAHELLVQWQKDGVDIPGAVSSYVDNYGYTTPALTIDDNGAQFRAALIVPGAPRVYSAPATLSMQVTNDGVATQLVSARRNPLNPDEVILTFNELMRPSSLLNLDNYVIDQGVVVTGARLSGTRKVVLTATGLAPLSNCVAYAISITGVQDANGTPASAINAVIPVSAAARVLFITGNAVGMNISDRFMVERLDAQGYEVDVISASAANRRGTAVANGMSMIFLSSQGGTTIGSTLRGLPIPTIVARRDLFDDYDFVPNGQLGTIATHLNLNIVDASHPLAGGLSSGIQQVVDTTLIANRTFNWASNLAPSAVIVARINSATNTQPAIFGFEAGAALLNSRTAASRRVGTYFEDNVAQYWNANGRALFDAMVNWAGVPAVLQQPATAMASVGGSITICVVAGSPGGANPTYQWYKDGVLISGATSERLILNNLMVGDSGVYTVRITNGAGTTVGTTTVTVVPPMLTIARGANTATLSWTGGGNLQEATTITGPWRDAANQSNPQTFALPSFGVYLDGAQDGGGARTGTGSGSVQLSNNAVIVNISYAGLSGTVTAAHIHAPAGRGTNANVIYGLSPAPVGGQAGTISQTITLVDKPAPFGTVAEQIQQLKSGLWYINIHTSPTFGGGEIRGQIDSMQFFRVVRP